MSKASAVSSVSWAISLPMTERLRLIRYARRVHTPIAKIIRRALRQTVSDLPIEWTPPKAPAGTPTVKLWAYCPYVQNLAIANMARRDGVSKSWIARASVDMLMARYPDGFTRQAHLATDDKRPAEPAEPAEPDEPDGGKPDAAD